MICFALAILGMCVIALLVLLGITVKEAGNTFQQGFNLATPLHEAQAARVEQLLDRIQVLAEGRSLLEMKRAQQVKPNDAAQHDEEMERIAKAAAGEPAAPTARPEGPLGVGDLV